MTKFVWFDLLSPEAAGAATFYQELFGWSIVEDGGDSGYATWLTDGAEPWAGIKSADHEPGVWVPFVQVDDLEVACDRARRLGGTIEGDVVAGPAGQSVVVSDPVGARVALFTPGSAT